MLRRRRASAQPNEWGVVFTAPLGGLRDPSNTQGFGRKVARTDAADVLAIFGDQAQSP